MSSIDNLLNKTMQDLQTKSKAQKNTYKKVVKTNAKTTDKNTDKTPKKTMENNIKTPPPSDQGEGEIKDLINTLKIPTENTSEKLSENTSSQPSLDEVLGDDDFSDGLIDGIDGEMETGEEDLNFGGEGDLGEDSMFDDYELMSEMGVQLIDTVMCQICMGLAKENDEEKYSISANKRAKLKKPLALLLQKRGTKLSPELAFGLIALILYSPLFILALKERKAKAEAEEKKSREVEYKRSIQSNVVIPQQEQVFTDNEGYIPKEREKALNSIKKKRGGRPKGSKDTGQRKVRADKGTKKTKKTK